MNLISQQPACGRAVPGHSIPCVISALWPEEKKHMKIKAPVALPPPSNTSLSQVPGFSPSNDFMNPFIIKATFSLLFCASQLPFPAPGVIHPFAYQRVFPLKAFSFGTVGSLAEPPSRPAAARLDHPCGRSWIGAQRSPRG